jgi:hypothetical protein
MTVAFKNGMVVTMIIKYIDVLTTELHIVFK